MKIRIQKAVLVVLFLLAVGLQVTANDPFLPLSAIRPGMIGYGLTVFAGTKVEAFPVEIVGIMEGSGSVAHLILIKFTGAHTLAAGMSGSPVFIGDKLIGAIGYGFQNSDHRYAMVTPIEEMLTLWSRKEAETFNFIEGGLAGFDGVIFGEAPANGNWLRASPVAAPLFLSGYGPRARQYLVNALAKQGVFTLQQGGGWTLPTFLPLTAAGTETDPPAANPPFQPGSALTISLVEGDYKVTALGTLTWLDGQKFLGFGHPFLNRGKVDFGVGGAEILSVIDNQDLPFKIGVAFPCRGRITQDRGAGVAGELGVLPKMVKVTTEVTDEESGLVRNYAFAVVNEENLLPNLVLAGVIDTIDRTLDRIGSGTANVYFELEGDNFDRFQRENLFCGPDVAAVAVQELGELLRVLTGNEFVHPGLTNVKVQVKINPQLLQAKIVKVELPKKEFAPGEKVTLTVHLLPYRGEVVETPFEVELPSTPGKWVLMVYGNEYDYVSGEQEGTEEELYSMDLYQSSTSLEERLADYRTRIQNNQLVVEFLPAAGLEGPELSETPEEEAEKVGEETEEEGSTRDYQTIDTPYFIRGQEQINIEVLPATGKEAPVWLKYEPTSSIDVTEL
ncbi:MAG TPA: hypothetical protein GXX33_05995 [Firmicutes bacterium]|uniref:Peptidase S55 domain-containing protein n=1 Tax=Capillibacterium thermochitinicola TaxID=2699427 RepID=A0A8J6I0G5_9FIRM|nr:hypothetical protein [Capillibacterium thermochitinicola]MBA2132459.1 hypothetical protein [Capillibacterium thermochitinicola]HHW12536.1 hypothetical protein [Bacillota bacterium]